MPEVCTKIPHGSLPSFLHRPLLPLAVTYHSCDNYSYSLQIGKYLMCSSCPFMLFCRETKGSSQQLCGWSALVSVANTIPTAPSLGRSGIHNTRHPSSPIHKSCMPPVFNLWPIKSSQSRSISHCHHSSPQPIFQTCGGALWSG